MSRKSRKWRWLGSIAGLLVIAFLVIRTYVVPAILVSQIQSQYHGKVVVQDWWFGLHSSGVTGVRLGETMANDTPTWFSADRISTNVSIARLIRGQVMPTRIEIDRPKVNFRIDAKGQPLTKIPVGTPGEPGPKAQPEVLSLPDIVTTNGEITLAQEGRQPMTLQGVNARLAPASDGGNLKVTTDDPTWGKISITGHFDPSFKNAQFQMTTGPGFVADPAKLAQIPFVPAEVWSNIEPRGPVDAKVDIRLAVDSPKPVSVHTELTMKGTDAKLKTLQVESTDTTGRVVIDDAMVKIEDLKGKTLDGSIGVNGTLDFGQKLPRMNLDVRLKGIDVTKAPAAWQLGEVGATGRLFGRVDLKLALDPKGPDLTGTAGRAVIEDGSFQGIPIKSLNLGLRADGNDIQYVTMPAGTVDKNHLEAPTPPTIAAGGKTLTTPPGKPGGFEIAEPVLEAMPLLELASHNQGFFGWAAYFVKQAITFQVKQATNQSGGGGLRLPKTISTRIELEDVELVTLVEKAKKFGIEIPVPVAGRFSINADATIPLGSLRDLKAYLFKGDATLKGASIDHVDLGLVSAHLEFVDGILDLSDFRGQLVDKPTGSELNPPKPTALPPAEGPLPPGAFRGNLHASLSPRGPASARFEGNHLPLGELLAPVLPHPSPLSGDLTVQVDAKGDLARLTDPKNWSVQARADSRRIKYMDAVLDEVATNFVVNDGRLDIPDFAARLLGKPLKAKGGLDLAAPYRYHGTMSVEAWQIAEVLAFVPGVPRPSPASGALDAKGDASGTLQPFAITTQGAARLLGAKAGPASIGNLGFRWKTDADTVAIDGMELFAFGGKATGEARIPIHPGKPLQASVVLKGIETARISEAFLGKNLAMAGKADGYLRLSMPMDASVIDATADLESPNLTIREGNAGGVGVKSLLITAVAREGQLSYDATASSLGGKLRFHGSAPIVADLSKVVIEGEVLAVGFRLGEVWKGLGMSGGLSHLDGLGAFDANVRAPIQPFQLASRGKFELRDLRYGTMSSIGNLRGIASLTPTSWRVDELEGDLLGGPASGEAHSETMPSGSKVMAFDFKVDRASLSRITKLFPSLAKDVEGYGSLRVGGRVAEALQANAEILVPRAKVYGIPITDLRLPAEVEMNPASGIGSVHSRHWTARMAGGSVRGGAWNRFGPDRSFQGEIQLSGVDLEVLSKIHPSGKRPPTGKVSGKITLNGPDPDHIAKIRGRVDLNLADASLVELPLFKELDRFLGASSGGGLFDDGNVLGTIANRTLYVEQMTLSGRLVQIHATGSITFSGGLNLEVLVNTNSIIGSSGSALLNVIPGLGQAIGRGEEAIRRVTSFLESSLLKFRVTGTTSNPRVQLDPGVSVGSDAVGFFSSVLKVPASLGR